MASFYAECPDLGLARGDALGRRLEAMVQGVAHEMSERGVELLQDVAVDSDVAADDLEADLFS